MKSNTDSIDSLLELVDYQGKKIKLLEHVIDEQRLRIKLLQVELNNKYWWKFWK